MKDYIKSTLRELNPEHVILHVGTNDLNSPLRLKEIADGIIGLTKSKKMNNRNITISSRKFKFHLAALLQRADYMRERKLLRDSQLT